MKNKSKIKTIIIILGIIFALSTIGNLKIISDQGDNKGTMEIRNETNFNSLKRSGFWANCPSIHIKNDNWSETALDWIQVNSGTENDPHIIENVTIDAGGLGNAILIENSSDYFIIRNCTLTNSGSDNNAGIFLNNTLNGQLVNNSCTNNNFHGICLSNKSNNTIIVNNTVNNNDRHGIKLQLNCSGNTVLGNKANYNGRCGIVLSIECNNNSILGNECKFNGVDPLGNYFGIYIVNDCNDNLISGNIASNNEWYGIYLINGCDNNTISGNTARRNLIYGILVRDNSNENKILGNNASNNRYGIGLYNCDENTISGNTANNAGTYGIYLRIDSDNNVISENIANNIGKTGILLDENCDNNTLSGNILYYNGEHGVLLSNDCLDNNITANYIFDNNYYGVFVRINSDDNIITANYIYQNTQWSILIDSANCDNTLISKNVMVSSEMKFINDAGTNTTLKFNYFGITLPSFTVKIIAQSFSTLEFIITINMSSQCIGLELSAFLIQMWWNGIIVSSNNIIELGNGLYNLYLTPIFVTPGEDPVLLNMTISAAYHRDKYFETYISVDPIIIINILQVEITEHSYSLEHFNLTIFVCNETELGIDSAIIQIRWNGVDVSNDVINLGNGFYFVSLEPITVAPGEDPILLNVIISADGYQDKSFETYIAVDPDTLDKEIGESAEEFPLTIIIIASISIAGGIGVAGITIFLLRKRKRASEVK